MNVPAQKNKILTILIVLLIFCLMGLGYWYVSSIRSQKYPFLDDSTKGLGTNVTKGFIYNTRIEENSYIFDFNSWNEEKRESNYEKGIVLDLEKYKGDVKELPTDQNLSIVLTTKVGLMGNLQEWKLEEFKLTEGSLKDLIKNLYTNVSTFNMAKDDTLVPGDITTEVYKYSNRETNEIKETSHNSGGVTSLTLYPFWMDSYILKYKESLGLEIEVEDLITKVNEYVRKKEEYDNQIKEIYERLTCENNDCEYPDPEDLVVTSHFQSNSLGCDLIKEILVNTNNREVVTILQRDFCNKENIQEDLKFFSKSPEYVYNKEDLLAPIDIGLLEDRPNKEFSDFMIPPENVVNFISDSLVTKEVNGLTLSQVDIQNIELWAIQSFFLGARESIGIKDVCNLAYSIKSAQNYREEPFYDEILTRIKEVLLEDLDRTLSLFDNSVYASYMCLEAYKEDNELKNILYSRVYGSLLLNLYNEDNKKGIWENDDYYSVRTNSRLIKILLENYENFK